MNCLEESCIRLVVSFIVVLFFVVRLSESDTLSFAVLVVIVVSLDSWQVDGTKYRAQLLKSYIERRGVNVPFDFVQPKVFLVNPDCK